ncbi:MAG TPA: hypothetical protein QGH28_08975 [Chloroflexota bacterium]|nr:hypothetical protein [Chloroflexota bacterium]|tara:strand:+ start:116 stop:610 length:495 start_codon:yes stop_codon:yes gene_type:complete
MRAKTLARKVAEEMAALTRVGWVASILVGIAFIVLGIVFISLSYGAKDEIRTAMIAEDVTTSKDATVPNALVQDVETARAEEAILTEHTRGRNGPYTSMDREDPNRESYLKGLTLRNSLNLSIMGFGVADLALGVGVVAILMGASTMLLTSTALYAVRRSRSIN